MIYPKHTYLLCVVTIPQDFTDAHFTKLCHIITEKKKLTKQTMEQKSMSSSGSESFQALPTS